MLKRKGILLSGILLLGALAFGKTYQIGSSQIVEHPALDAVRVGVEEELKRSGIDFKFDSQIAQGDMTIQQLIMQKFAKDKKDFIVAISTPTLQAGMNATKEIPILFGAVTDPVVAGVTNDVKNVTGVSDKIHPQLLIDLTKELLPKAKTVGVVYNPGEKNSEGNAKLLEEVTKKQGFKLVAIGATSTSELPLAIDAVLSKVDVLYIFTDNLTVAAAPLIYSKAKMKNIPVIAMEGQVEMGALAGFGMNYKDSGIKIGKMIVEMINGKNIQEIPAVYPVEYPVLINEKVAQTLGVTIPEKYKK